MLIRKAAFLAAVSSGFFGAAQAEAGCFGKRNCCQTTPVVCPPCNVPVVYHGSLAPATTGVLGHNSVPCCNNAPVEQINSCTPTPSVPVIKYRTEYRTRTVPVTKYRLETREEEIVNRDGSISKREVQIQVPYTEHIEQTYSVQVPYLEEEGQSVRSSSSIEDTLNKIEGDVRAIKARLGISN
ncbi:hypothetical protein [Novipirellula caenicola]|uniref:Uncharacterized protein n=1 Tax=Novipirellula caenicola TaxID=1536901 RepID=A0ABP9VNB4_9BACT